MRCIICVFAFTLTALAWGQNNIDHHIDIGHEYYDKHLKNAGHTHMVGGLTAVSASTMNISSRMRKDFYILSSASVLLGGGHYLATLGEYEKDDEKVIRKTRENSKERLMAKERYLATLVEKARQTRLVTSATQMSVGAGYIAYYNKYHKDPSEDAHSASLISLIVGVGKITSGLFHLFNVNGLEKYLDKGVEKAKTFTFDIGAYKNAPMLVWSGNF